MRETTELSQLFSLSHRLLMGPGGTNDSLSPSLPLTRDENKHAREEGESEELVLGSVENGS